MGESVVVSVEGGVRTVTLDRPEKRNALNQEMLAALLETFSGEPAPEERVVVVRSTGPVFCAGIDLKERMRGEFRGGPSPVEQVFHSIENYPLPSVAVVQGDAIAGGCELALHCDFVVASTEARFGMSQPQIGLAPTWFLAKKLLEVAGPVATREILLLGDPVPAQRMRDWGAIARVVRPESLEAEAAALVERLVNNAPLSLRATRALLVREMQFRDGIEHGDIDALVDEVRTSEDAREGIAARMEKRAPRFQGR